jgi:hypothetical protein
LSSDAQYARLRVQINTCFAHFVASQHPLMCELSISRA